MERTELVELIQETVCWIGEHDMSCEDHEGASHLLLILEKAGVTYE